MNFVNSIAQRFLKKDFPPLVLYIIFIFAIVPKGLQWPIQLAFVLYALFIFWIIWWHAWDKHGQEEIKNAKFFRYLLVCSGVFFVFSRFFLFVRYGEAPLGYDTGFYLKSMETVFEGAIGVDGHRIARALLWVPFLWLGVPKVYILHSLYVLSQFLIIGSLYSLARTMAVSSRLTYAAVLVFLFSVSLPQFFAYWWMFYQMEFAIAFLLMTLVLIHRRSVFALITAGFGAAIHPSTFFPFGIALGIFAVVQVMRTLFMGKKLERETLFIIGLGIIMIVIIQQFAKEFILIYLRGTVNKYGWMLTNYPDYIRQQFTGLYIGPALFRLADAYILPFGFLGVLLFAFNKLPYKKGSNLRIRLLVFLILSVILFFLSHYPFIYQNRFLIILDLVIILFAAYPFVYLLRYFLEDKKGYLVIMIFLLGFGAYSVYSIWKQKPQMYPDELQEIKAIAQVSDRSDYAMSTESLYTPWVYAFADRTTIDPGYLQYNKWTYEMWREFWYGGSDARRHELLNMYDRPIYIFVGKQVPETVRYKKFIKSDPYFEQISPHVWWYDPGRISERDVEEMYRLENPFEAYTAYMLRMFHKVAAKILILQ
ncbi:MAG: hypothetical protein UX98_C0001G0020 [Parcubacteria group bacterium GW2011_GWA2_47_26]|nr:MAG: hypothetical protein UX98_C0001G0020 [Parcubacteria group bacterium GW2011_GWA2_47_26]